MKAGLGVRRPSLWSDFNQNSNVSKVFNGTPQYDMSLKSIQEFSLNKQTCRTVTWLITLGWGGETTMGIGSQVRQREKIGLNESLTL